MRTEPSVFDTDVDHVLAMLLADGASATRKAQALLQQAGSDARQRGLALSLCSICAAREGSAAEAWACLEQARALGTGTLLGDRASDLLCQAHALCLRREGRVDEAWRLLTELHTRTPQRPVLDAYFCASSLGTVLSMRGQDDEALDVFYQALELARRSGVDSLRINALNNLGSSQSDLFNLEDAAPMLEECLAGALALGSRRQIIYAAGNLVQCLCWMGQAERALALAREHLIGQIRPEDPPQLHRDEEIAQALLDNGLVDEARAALGGEPRVDPFSNELATVRVWLGARILLAQGQADEALQLCLQRQQLLTGQGEAGTVAMDRVNLLRLAAEAADRVGDAALAYRLLVQAHATHEQLLGRAARSRQLSLQITHRLRQAEWERDTARQLAARLEALNASLRAQVAENERLHQQLRAQALEDPLTGLHNRRHLMDAGAALLALMRRRREPLAVALVDLDHFKQVNDRHGHEAGDRVLQGFAQLARQATRAEDLVCRYGGEEFVLLMPGAPLAQAQARLEQLLRAFGQLHFEGSAGPFACSFSAGLAVSSVDSDALSPLLARADAALYEAKQAGRARVGTVA